MRTENRPRGSRGLRLLVRLLTLVKTESAGLAPRLTLSLETA